MENRMVNSYPVNFIECSTKRDISQNSKVFNVHELENGLILHIPEEFASDIYLYGLHELEPNDAEVFITDGLLVRHGLRPWLDVNKALLDVTIGYHVYRLDFIHKYTNDIINMYFAYYLQDSHPDKPYVYMEDNN